jgi:hypothetical protein
MRKYLSFLIFLGVTAAYGQYEGGLKPLKGIEYKAEAQVSVSDNKTPLWLNANKYGLSSLEKTNGYVRAAAIRPLAVDSARRWGIGYGLDVAGAYHYTSKPIVQQAFVEGRWLHGTLSIGSKEYPMELKNNQLSSGSQTLGVNARPVPQVRLALPDYWTLPIFNGWVHLKGHIAYGKTTDDNWQADFTQRNKKYTEDVLYHSKAGYLKIGNEDVFFPLYVELGLEMACMFGGTSWQMKDGVMTPIKSRSNLKALYRAFIPGGGDVVEQGTAWMNEEGNHLGSWLMRVNYDTDTWRFSVYADKYFEDHSSMLQVDYDGYGEGEEWNVKKKRRFLVYDFKDCLLGGELNLKYGSWLRDIVFEYVYTKYQSGPIYHDHNATIQDHISGRDNFYNHYITSGWQHWGQVMGNPLYLSPIYNEDGLIQVENNRFIALHLGVDGNILENLGYRILASWQDGLGTYGSPYAHRRYNTSLLVEADYHFTQPKLRGWSVKGAYAMDFGKIRGDNTGFQLTITKTGFLTSRPR